MTQTADLTANARAEPLPGYVATERIGAGGYGEVWKVTAPGGVEKAVKTLHGYHDEDLATRELKALERIKDVRHPFLLSLDRFEIYDGRLVVVMELADMSLERCFQLHRKKQRDGIPHDELISYLRDAAEALDYMQQHHDLQHLDIKPENLLLSGRHVKVADFGLVKEVVGRTLQSMIGGMTPTYAAPEIFDNRPSPWTDQYSLAIVYQEMLTGILPFPGRTAAQLVAQHTQGTPRVAALPEKDRAVVLKALSKKPADRFASCSEFVNALAYGMVAEHGNRQSVGEPAPTESNTPANEDTEEVATSVTEPVSGRSPPPHERLVTEPMEGGSPLPNHQNLANGGESAPSSRFAGEANGPGGTNPYLCSTESPVCRGEAALPRGEEDATSTVVVSTEIRELPVPERSSEVGQLQPTLVIGLGGIGGNVVERLQSQLLARDGEIPWPAFVPMVVLDTDRQAVNGLRMRSVETVRGSMIDVQLIPLRMPQQYQSQSSDLLRWLSRRWLYNIPRSLHTRGYRPLGRLALIDNARFVLERFESHLCRLAERSEVKKTALAHGLSCRGDRIRVVIISSTGGGTGSGIALDLAFAIRNIAEACNVGDVEVIGHFVDSSREGDNSNDLAVANTYAFLKELSTTGLNGNRGSNGMHRIMDLFEGDASPWDHTYLAGLGGTESGVTVEDWVEQAAQYLAVDVISEAGADLEACRTASPTTEEPFGAMRSFVVATLGEGREETQTLTQTVEKGDTNQLMSLLEADLAAIHTTIEGITIHPKHCGHQRRMLVVIPSDWPNTAFSEVVRKILPGAMIRHAAISRPLVIDEAAELSLAQVAAHLADHRPDAVEAAQRLHARNDVPWTSLPRVVVQ